MNLHIRRLIAIFAAAVAIVGSDMMRAQTGGPAERFTAVAVSIGPTGQMKSSRLEMTVTKWCTDDDVSMLIGRLVEDGPDALLDTLQETCPVGYLQLSDGTRYDLLFAQRVTGQDGERGVILLTDLVTVSPAAVEATPSGYGFALIELRLNRDGDGEGEMSIATMAPREEHAVVGPDDYWLQSIRLLGVLSSTLPTS